MNLLALRCKVCDCPVYTTRWSALGFEPLCARCLDWAIGILGDMFWMYSYR